MAMVINNNMMAANTARNLSNTYNKLGTSIQRMSTGLRVNSAADDAAGLAIRELMRSDISTTQQGIRNAADGISMIQTADGSLGVIDEKLTRMKELAEQAATGTYTTVQRDIINSEYQAMAAEIDRIAAATEFNGIKLLDGSVTNQHGGKGVKIHFGTGNNEAEDYYYVNIGDARATSSTGLRVGGDAKNDIWGQGAAASGALAGPGCCTNGFSSLNGNAGFISGQTFSYGYNWDWMEDDDPDLLTGKYLAGRYTVGSSDSLQDLVMKVNAGTQSRVGIKVDEDTLYKAAGQGSGTIAICVGHETYYWGDEVAVGGNEVTKMKTDYHGTAKYAQSKDGKLNTADAYAAKIFSMASASASVTADGAFNSALGAEALNAAMAKTFTHTIIDGNDELGLNDGHDPAFDPDANAIQASKNRDKLQNDAISAVMAEANSAVAAANADLSKVTEAQMKAYDDAKKAFDDASAAAAADPNKAGDKTTAKTSLTSALNADIAGTTGGSGTGGVKTLSEVFDARDDANQQLQEANDLKDPVGAAQREYDAAKDAYDKAKAALDAKKGLEATKKTAFDNAKTAAYNTLCSVTTITGADGTGAGSAYGSTEAKKAIDVWADTTAANAKDGTTTVKSANTYVKVSDAVAAASATIAAANSAVQVGAYYTDLGAKATAYGTAQKATATAQAAYDAANTALEEAKQALTYAKNPIQKVRDDLAAASAATADAQTALFDAVSAGINSASITGPADADKANARAYIEAKMAVDVAGDKATDAQKKALEDASAKTLAANSAKSISEASGVTAILALTEYTDLVGAKKTQAENQKAYDNLLDIGREVGEYRKSVGKEDATDIAAELSSATTQAIIDWEQDQTSANVAVKAGKDGSGNQLYRKADGTTTTNMASAITGTGTKAIPQTKENYVNAQVKDIIDKYTTLESGVYVDIHNNATNDPNLYGQAKKAGWNEATVNIGHDLSAFVQNQINPGGQPRTKETLADDINATITKSIKHQTDAGKLYITKAYEASDTKPDQLVHENEVKEDDSYTRSYVEKEAGLVDYSNQKIMVGANAEGRATYTASALATAINKNEKSEFWAMTQSVKNEKLDKMETFVYVFHKDGGDHNDLLACEQAGRNDDSKLAADAFDFENVGTGNWSESGTSFSLGGEHWATMKPVQTKANLGNEVWNVTLDGRDVGKERDLWISNYGEIKTPGLDESLIPGLDRNSFQEIQNASNAEWAGADVRTQSAAQESLAAINDAIVRKDKIRADLGALQNRLENTITNLEIQNENLQASESRISDVDTAKEMTEFTKNNVLTQAGVSMLSQANSMSQLCLSLLGG